MGRLRGRRLELGLVVLLAAEVGSVAAADVERKPLVLLLSALSVVVLLGLRRLPLVASVAAFALLAAQLVVMPQSTVAQFFGTLATFALVGAFNVERDAVVGWAAGAAMLAYASWGDPRGGGAGDFVLSLAFGSAMWLAGLLVARHRRRVEAVLGAAEQAERGRATATARAVADERARIARELHDVVSHGLSVVVVQTAAARGCLADGAPDPEVDRHLDAAESTARDALGEMRRLLALLRLDADGEDSVDPAPRLDQVEALVARALPGRATVSVVVDEPVPAGVELAAYRVVQESLTNVLRHAPGAEVAVDVRRHAHRLDVVVRNGPSPRPRDALGVGAGRGLVGVRERAALYGGTAASTPTADGGFEVRVSFPLAAEGLAPRPIALPT